MLRKVLAVSGAVLVVLVLLMVAAAYVYWPAEDHSYVSAWRQHVDSRFVDTPVAEFHYVTAGEGPPVVLLAPSPGWAIVWQHQLEGLSDGHTVYAVDLPGNTGYTRLKDEDFSYDLADITHALESFLDAIHVERTALVGNSWGGGWALAFAERHPERVSRLVLIDASGLDLPEPASWEAIKYPVVGELLTKLTTSKSAVRSYGKSVVDDQSVLTDRLVDEIYAPMTYRDNVRAVYEGERALDWRETDRALASVSAPTLVVWGRDDPVYDVSRAAEYGRRIRRAQVVVLDRCAHSPELDCSDRLNPVLRRFLGGTG